MNTSTPPLYTFYLEQHTTNLKRLKQVRNALTGIKLLLFCLICWMLYFLIATSIPLYGFSLLGAIVAFLVMTVMDSRQVIRIELTESLLSEITLEHEYLKGDRSRLSKGAHHATHDHPYCHDLDIFGENSLFESINRTITPRGEETLANWLMTGELDTEKLYKRQKAVDELSHKTEGMFFFRAWLRVFPVTVTDEMTINRWSISRPFIEKNLSKIAIYISTSINIALWIGVVIGVVNYAIPLNYSILQMIASFIFTKKINRQQKEASQLLGAMGNLFYVVQHIQSLTFDSSLCKKLKESLLGNQNALTAFRLLRKRMEGLDQRNNIMVSIALNALYMRDLHEMMALDRWKLRFAPYLNSWLDAIAHFDALFSLANFRHNHPQFTFPTFTEEPIIDAQALLHPLLPNDTATSNDFAIQQFHQFCIITGANMSGKSTFLRTIGTNLVLAQAGSVVAAKQMSCRPIRLFTSMRTTDNLSKGTSYFHAELLRLQQLVHIAQNDTPLFIILDEMLKGTNSEDKLNGSYRFLQRLCNLPLVGIVATHDLELGRLQHENPSHFFNRCFEIDHQGNQIVYDYKLKEGVSQNMNATILLKQMGLI